MPNIDLRELSQRESERIEWKLKVADVENVVKTISAFANDYSNLGGGYVVCGAEEKIGPSGFQTVDFVGLESGRYKEIENRVLAHCREYVDPAIVPVIEEIDIPGDSKRVLIFIVPSTNQAHSYRPPSEGGGKYFVRISRETREARNGILRELLVKKGAQLPWDRRVCNTASIEDIDLILFREYLQEMGIWDDRKSIETYLSNEDQISSFVPPITQKIDIEGKIRPKNFGLLLFSSKPTKFYPGAFTVISIYKGRDKTEQIAERHEETGPIIEQTKRVISILNSEAYTAFDKTDTKPNQVKYPRRALQEAAVNAIVHRDYEIDQPTRITIFSDRVEFYSPGALPRAISKDRFLVGKSSPYWRNQTLAYFFSKLQLAQSEGQGIPTIIKTMKDEGCPNPEFVIEEESVTCILPAHHRHEIYREIQEAETEFILKNTEASLQKIESVLKKDPYNFRALELYCDVNNYLKTPLRVFDFISNGKLNFNEIKPSTCIQLAETILLVNGNSEASLLATKLLDHGRDSRLEESEIKKIATNYRKMKNDEKAIKFINEQIKLNKYLSQNSSLLDIRAKAKMDLAKKCMDTGRTRRLSKEIKGKAWAQCRAYLEEAEKDLTMAFGFAVSPIEKDYISRDIEFLKTMQSIAKKPRPRTKYKKPNN